MVVGMYSFVGSFKTSFAYLWRAAWEQVCGDVVYLCAVAMMIKIYLLSTDNFDVERNNFV